MRRPRVVVAALLAVCQHGSVLARQAFQSLVPNGAGVPCPPRTPGCVAGVCPGVGHATCVGGTQPLNPFGEAFAAAGFAWTRSLCAVDSDGDGLTNGEARSPRCNNSS